MIHALHTSLILSLAAFPADTEIGEISKCQGCVVTNRAKLVLPETNIEAYAFKLLHPETSSKLDVVVTRNGDMLALADKQALQRAEEVARRSKRGSMSKRLSDHLSTIRPSDSADISIWVRHNLPVEPIIKEQLSSKQLSLASELALFSLSSTKSEVVEWIKAKGGSVLASDSSPWLRARLAGRDIRDLAYLTQVAAIEIDTWPGTHTTTAWYHTIRAADALGSGQTKIATHEGCQPDNYSNLLVAGISNPQACGFSHERIVAGAIANSSFPPGSNNDALVYISSWDVWEQSGNSQDSPEHWCFDQGVRLFNFSHSFSDGSPGNANAVDMRHDYFARNYPYSLWVSSSGNTGGVVGYDVVHNRGYNGLVIGATDDHGTTSSLDDTIAAFSSWRNPANLHSDYELPNMVAPGVNVDVLGAPRSGTSLSAPFVTGCLGNAYSRASHFSNWPELGRAVAMASSFKTPSGQPSFSRLPYSQDARHGTGMLDCYEMSLLADPVYKSYIGAPYRGMGYDARTLVFSSDFDSSGMFYGWTAAAVQSGTSRMRVVIAFDGTAGGCDQFGNNCGTSLLDADLDLYVVRMPSEEIACSSASYDSSWEGCDFAVTYGEKFRIDIKKLTANSTHTYLGVAWRNYAP